jgi:hypothetical protein
VFSISGKASICGLLLNEPVECLINLNRVPSLFVCVACSKKAEDSQSGQSGISLTTGEITIDSVFIDVNLSGAIV